MAGQEESNFIPALGSHWFTPFYQSTVDLFCKDDVVKKLLLECLPKDEAKVLDIACGTGKLLSLMATAQPCCRFEGMDIDPVMVSASKGKTEALPNVNVTQGDATAPPFPRGEFDAVVESLMFHHLTDEQKIQSVKAIWKLLKPNGVFFFVDWVQPQTRYAAFAFKIIQLVDGHTTTDSHKNNAVIEMIKEHGPFTAGSSENGGHEPAFVNTSLGTIGIIPFVRAEPDVTKA